MGDDSRFENEDRNDLSIRQMGAQMPMQRIPPGESQPWQWYNDGVSNKWLPADRYSEQKYLRVKKFKLGKLSNEELKQNKETKTEYQLTMNF